MQAPSALKRLVYPDRGGLARVSFDEDGPTSVLLPDQERFGLTRELVLQRVYDRWGGIEGELVVDAGANVGFFSVIASKKAGRVVALEPDAVNFRVLELNLTANAITNVEPLNMALWTEDGTVSFQSGTHHTDGSVKMNGGGDVQVKCISLASLVEKYGPIDLLKLDIEGAEKSVLSTENEALKSVRRIVAELHLFNRAKRAPMIEALENAGFDVEVIESDELYKPSWVPQVLRNWSRVEGQLMIKLGVLLYLLAPIEKPRKPGRDMPLLVATRGGAG